MATHLCMFGTDNRNTGIAPCGADSMVGYSTVGLELYVWATANEERFVTRAHLADCGVCLVTAEQMVTSGLAKYVAAEAYEDLSRTKMVAYLELTRDVAAYAPPGDYWVCECSVDHPQAPTHFTEVDGRQFVSCVVCDWPRGTPRTITVNDRGTFAAGYLISSINPY